MPFFSGRVAPPDKRGGAPVTADDHAFAAACVTDCEV